MKNGDYVENVRYIHSLIAAELFKVNRNLVILARNYEALRNFKEQLDWRLFHAGKGFEPGSNRIYYSNGCKVCFCTTTSTYLLGLRADLLVYDCRTDLDIIHHLILPIISQPDGIAVSTLL